MNSLIGKKVLFLNKEAVIVFVYGSGKIKIRFNNNTEHDVEKDKVVYVD